MPENDKDLPPQEGRSKEKPTGQPEGAISTEDLFRGRDEVLIRHGDDTYRLRITRAGKLILHK